MVQLACTVVILIIDHNDIKHINYLVIHFTAVEFCSKYPPSAGTRKRVKESRLELGQIIMSDFQLLTRTIDNRATNSFSALLSMLGQSEKPRGNAKANWQWFAKQSPGKDVSSKEHTKEWGVGSAGSHSEWQWWITERNKRCSDKCPGTLWRQKTPKGLQSGYPLLLSKLLRKSSEHFASRWKWMNFRYYCSWKGW